MMNSQGSSGACHRCGRAGHLARDCSLHTCFRCNGRGHMAWECAEGLTCMRCGEVGHLQRNCKNVSCHKCGQKGHISKYCTDPFVKAVEVEREEHRQLILAVRSGGLLGVAIGAGPGAGRAFPGISNAPGLAIGQVPGGTGPWDGLGRGRGGIGGRASWAIPRGRGFPLTPGVGGNTGGRDPQGGRWNSHSTRGRGERRAGESTASNKQGGEASGVSPSAPLASWAPSPLAQNSASQKALVAQRVRVVEKRAKRKHGEGGNAEGAECCRKREGCGEETEAGKDADHQAAVMHKRAEVAGASLLMERRGEADGKVASDTRGPSLWEGLVAYGSADDEDNEDDSDDGCDTSRGELGDAVGGHNRDDGGTVEQSGKVPDDVNSGVCVKSCTGAMSGNDDAPTTSQGPSELDAEYIQTNCVNEHEESINEAISGGRQVEGDLLGTAKEIQSLDPHCFDDGRGVDVSRACALWTNEGSACLRESISAELNSPPPPQEDTNSKIAGQDVQLEALSTNDSLCEKDGRTVQEDEDTVSPDNPVKSRHDDTDCRLGGALVRCKKDTSSSHFPGLNRQIDGDSSSRIITD